MSECGLFWWVQVGETLFWVSGSGDGVWVIIFGGWGLVEVEESLFWVGGGRWENILRGCG